MLKTICRLAAACLWALASPAFAQEPVTAADIVTKLLSRSTPISEGYRQQFHNCDRANMFRGYKFPGKFNGGTYYPCKKDPSRVAFLNKVTVAQQPIVMFESKQGIDVDGSYLACNYLATTALCGTSLSFRDRTGKDCPGRNFGSSKRCPVDADTVDYVVIPVRGPTTALSREFRTLTKVNQGDFGVVILGNKVIPVIVADGGPFNKLGEGSIELNRNLGHEVCVTFDSRGRCKRIRNVSHPQQVTTILFPGSRIGGKLTGANISARTKIEAMRRWAAVAGAL